MTFWIASMEILLLVFVCLAQQVAPLILLRHGKNLLPGISLLAITSCA